MYQLSKYIFLSILLRLPGERVGYRAAQQAIRVCLLICLLFARAKMQISMYLLKLTSQQQQQ